MRKELENNISMCPEGLKLPQLDRKKPKMENLEQRRIHNCRGLLEAPLATTTTKTGQERY